MRTVQFAKMIAKSFIKEGFSAFSNIKYHAQWKITMENGHTSITDRLPWITFPAISMLKKKLTNSSKVFEFGGGGSTLFFLDHAATVVTVEHNPEWYALLQGSLTASESARWTGKLILPETKEVPVIGDPGNPADYYSHDENFKGKTFKGYATAIDIYPDNHFDIVLVDGRVRPSCVIHSLKKIKPGGYLVLDNADRGYYFHNLDVSAAGFQLVLEGKGPVPFTDFNSQTNIWIKR